MLLSRFRYWNIDRYLVTLLLFNRAFVLLLSYCTFFDNDILSRAVLFLIRSFGSSCIGSLNKLLLYTLIFLLLLLVCFLVADVVD